MGSGFHGVWLVTWSLWAVVIARDVRREPRDWRWIVWLAALFAAAAATRDTLREVNLRFVLLSGLAVVVLVGWTAADLLNRRRRPRLSAWARSHGYGPTALESRRAEATLPEGLRRLPMLGRGRWPRTEGLLSRDDGDGRERLVFDHTIRRKVVWYDSGVEATGTVVAIRRRGMWLPLFQVRPVGLFAWMDGGPLGEPVPTAGNAAFARSYRLGGHEPRNLRALFTDDLLAAITERPGWLIEGEGEWIAAFAFDRAPSLMSLKTSTLRTVKVGGLEAHIGEASRLLDRIADHAARSAERGAGAA